MDIQKLLAYAKVDAEMTKFNLAYNNEPDVKEFNLQGKRYKESSALIAKLNGEGEDLIKQMNDQQERYKKATEDLERCKVEAADIENEYGADRCAKDLERLIGTLVALSSDITTLGKRIAEVRTQTSTAFKVAQESTKRAGELKASYQQTTEKYKPQFADINNRLNESAKGLGEELNIYLNLKKNAVKNRIVMLNGESCGGCYMGLDAGTLSKIQAQGWILCPNCGRILYVDDKK